MAVADVRHDWRPALLGAAAWTGGLLAHHGGWSGLLALAVTGASAAAGVTYVARSTTRSEAAGSADPVSASGSTSRRETGDVATRGAVATWRRWIAALVLLALAVGVGALVRHRATDQEPLRGWAEQRAIADLEATVTSDPRTVHGLWGDQVVVRVRLVEVTARGATVRLGVPALVLGDTAWSRVPLGARVSTTGRLSAVDDPALAALVTGADPPRVVSSADLWWRASAGVRASIRAAVADRPSAQRALVPALVDGDDSDLSPELEADFATCGLTHLTAVSGTNLTLIVGCLLLLARALGVRGRWLHLIGLLGIVGFILLARTEPSVLRAAAMGTVGLFALGTDGRRRGLRALGIGMSGLLLITPGLAISAGFALSVLATAGIVILVPGMQAALRRWLPEPVAAAIAVPLAAQLACTPVVAALSGEVSLVAVVANLLAGPAVGPATVLGLLAGLVGLVHPTGGALLGRPAAWCVAWIVEVAERGAALPGAAIGWGTGMLALTTLGALCLTLAFVLPRLLRSQRVGALVAIGAVLVVVGVPGCTGPPRLGDDWVMALCDVGQGDAVVLSAGADAAVVVDVGPDPEAVDLCLDELGISQVPLVMLTHFHADHVGGLDGVLDGRSVAAIETTSVLDPPESADRVVVTARAAGVPVAIAPYGAARSVGDLRWQVVAPDLAQPVPGAGDGTSANDASVALLVESAGLRILLTGDLEPEGQAALAARLPGLDIDVLKVPHHGSSHQDHAWLASLRPEVAVIGVGADNDYGHPSTRTLSTLRDVGAEVARTDTDGRVVVSVGTSGEPPQVTTQR